MVYVEEFWKIENPVQVQDVDSQVSEEQEEVMTKR